MLIPKPIVLVALLFAFVAGYLLTGIEQVRRPQRRNALQRRGADKIVGKERLA